MAIFLTADPHLMHLKVSGLRGFDTPEKHDLVLKRNWNRVVSHDDLVYILGDVVMGPNKKETFRRLHEEFNGRKILVLGNHDRGHPGNRNGHLHLHDGEYDGFEAVVQSASIRHEGREFLLSHFPYDGDHADESRFDQWRLRDLGVPLLHGHTHSSDKVTYSDAGTPQICVGMEAWKLTPVPLGEAAGLV